MQGDIYVGLLFILMRVGLMKGTIFSIIKTSKLIIKF